MEKGNKMIYVTRVKFYDDDTQDSKYYDCFVVAESYMDAVQQMVDYYGEHYIEKLYVEIFAPNNFLEFTSDDHNLFDTVKERLSKRVLW